MPPTGPNKELFMLTSPKFAFVITILFLALSACGSLESAQTDPRKKTSAINSSPGTDRLSLLSSACVGSGGRMSANGEICLKKETKFLTAPDSNPNLVIDSNFLNGKFIVATAGATSAANSVEILYDGRAFAKVPARMQGDIGLLPAGRPLTFFVNTPNYKDVTVTVWTCYSGTIDNRVICPPAQIP
jgi:hypothetical protein